MLNSKLNVRKKQSKMFEKELNKFYFPTLAVLLTM